MTTAHRYLWAERVVLFLAATLIWIITAAAIAPAHSPGLAGVLKAPGQARPKTLGKQAPKGAPVLTGISPSSVPLGGIGELVLTGKNFAQGMKPMMIGDIRILRFEVQSPERAVAMIYVPLATPEGSCALSLQYWLTENGEISPSPWGTPEEAQMPSSVSCTISKSARTMPVQAPPPVLTGISPNSAPPGGIGELVLTGKNFARGLELSLDCAHVPSLKVESAERAVGQIHVDFGEPQRKCETVVMYIPTPKGATSPPPEMPKENGDVANSVSFTINSTAPMALLLGDYTLFPEEEITFRKSQEASARQLEAGLPPREQMQKQQAQMKEMEAKYKRGEITEAEYTAYKMKAVSSMMAQMAPMMQQAAGAQTRMTQQSQKFTELQKQEKNGELRLNKGSVSFLAGGNTLFTEPVSAVKEISVVSRPPHESPDEFQVAFKDGKKYFFRAKGNVEYEVSELKKHLGK